jgi:hypothetical protein
VHHGVDPVVHVVDVGERLGHLPEVGEVDPDEGRWVRQGGRGRIGDAVQRDHPVPVLREVRDDVAAELAAASGDGEGRHAPILSRPRPSRRPSGVRDRSARPEIAA